MKTSLNRAYKLMESGDLYNAVFHWLDSEDEALAALSALATIAAAGIELRLALAASYDFDDRQAAYDVFDAKIERAVNVAERQP